MQGCQHKYTLPPVWQSKPCYTTGMTVREALQHGGRLHSMSCVLPYNVSQDSSTSYVLPHALFTHSNQCIVQKTHVENSFDVKDDLLTI